MYFGTAPIHGVKLKDYYFESIQASMVHNLSVADKADYKEAGT